MSAARLLPWPLHGIVEYVAGLFVILAPFLFGFADERPTFPVFIGVGVVILAVAVLTRSPAGVVDVLPPPLHAALDYLLALFLVVAPFLFGFDSLAARNCFIFLGVAHFVVTLITSFPSAPAATDAGAA